MEQKVPLEELKILCRLAMEKVSVLEKQETEVNSFNVIRSETFQ